jgi:hypothetical protein
MQALPELAVVKESTECARDGFLVRIAEEGRVSRNVGQ